MSTGGRAHDPDAVRVEVTRFRLAAHDADCTLKILPGACVLREAIWTRCAVFERDDRHALFVQISPCRRHTIPRIGAVIEVPAAGIDDLDALGARRLRKMPFEIWNALVRLCIRHLGIRPEWHPLVATPIGIIREAVGEANFVAKPSIEVHLSDEFKYAVKPVIPCRAVTATVHVAMKSVPTVREKMQLGGYLHPAELTVYLRRSQWRKVVRTTVEQAHRAGLAVKRKLLHERDVGRISLAGVRHALAIGQHVCRRLRHGEEQIARQGIEFIDWRIRRRLRRCGQKKDELGAGRYSRGADPLRAEAPLRRMRSHEPYGSLRIFPAGLVYCKPLRTRCTVRQVRDRHARADESVNGRLQAFCVAAGREAAARDHEYGEVCPVRRIRRIPVDVRSPKVFRTKRQGFGLIRRRGNLVRLFVWHLAFRPDVFAQDWPCRRRQGSERRTVIRRTPCPKRSCRCRRHKADERHGTLSCAFSVHT